MSVVKYRVHEVSKDFNINSKEIIDLLDKYFPEKEKNHMTSLENIELDIVFEYLTTKGAVENFFEYFRQGDEARKKAEQEEAERAAAQKAKEEEEAKAAAKRAKDAAEAAKKAAVDAQKAEKAAKDKAAKEKRAAQMPVNNTPAPQPKSFEIKKKAPSQQTPQVQKKGAGTTVVDMRGGDVNLARYDERLDQLVPAKIERSKDFGNRKQKFNKRPDKRQPTFIRKETESEKLQRLQLEKARKAQLSITIPDEISVADLATRLKKTSGEVVKKLVMMGVMASTSQVIDFDTAALIADEFNVKWEKEVNVTIEERLFTETEDTEENLVPRSPVVVVMGHVDHGKTSLLDCIRNANVAEGEAGGITQHIGAYKVKAKGREITFLDTPGHAAFTSMRARGAQVTDIAILVVAADDGIMPQTIEAINHAKAAGVAIIVAINKIDKPGANPENIKQQLTEHELVPEEWGGDVICVNVSAKQKTNIDQLLEYVLLTADMQELKANPNRAASGTVIEAKLDKGRGPVATILVQKGTLNSGDIIIAGTTVGRVRAMYDDKGNKIETAGPSDPVEIVGLSDVPEAGDVINVVDDERLARELVEERREKQKVTAATAAPVSLDDLFAQIAAGDIKDLNIIVKADVQGSAEAVKASLEKLSNDEVRVRVIHDAVGAINESDIMLANASNAIVIGFNVRPDAKTRESAVRSKVDIRTYRVIYECIEEMEAAMKGMLDAKFTENIIGHAEVRQVFKVTGIGTIAGCMVQDGKIVRNAQARIVRDGIVIVESTVESLKRFKDDAKEVASGYECGIGLAKFNDIKDGDIIEAFIMEEIKR